MQTNEAIMKRIGILVFVVALGAGTLASAQDPHVVYDRERGELSPGTQIPTREALVNVIKSGSPTTLMAMLEYGERLECYECVPLLEKKILESDDARVREFSAWWLRRRPFAIGAVMTRMKDVLANDADPVRRSRAAEAIGEFLDPNGFTVLRDAAGSDGAAGVRASAIAALGRLNHPQGNATIANAIADSDPAVRKAALGVVLKVNFFREHAAILDALEDDDASIRRQGAQLLGELRVEAAVPALMGTLFDSDRSVRQASAWALGRIGTSDARTALQDAKGVEKDPLVLDAIEVALKMRR